MKHKIHNFIQDQVNVDEFTRVKISPVYHNSHSLIGTSSLRLLQVRRFVNVVFSSARFGVIP